MVPEGKWAVCNADDTGNALHVLTRTTHIEFKVKETEHSIH